MEEAEKVREEEEGEEGGGGGGGNRCGELFNDIQVNNRRLISFWVQNAFLVFHLMRLFHQYNH